MKPPQCQTLLWSSGCQNRTFLLSQKAQRAWHRHDANVNSGQKEAPDFRAKRMTSSAAAQEACPPSLPPDTAGHPHCLHLEEVCELVDRNHPRPFHRYMGCSAHMHRQPIWKLCRLPTLLGAFRHSSIVFYGDIVPGQQAHGLCFTDVKT